MKARRKNSNDDWQEIAYILLENSRFPQSADLMEFEQETTGGTKYLPNYIYDHWQDVRERAAIAAMGQLIGTGRDDGYKYSPLEVANFAVVYANALVEQLKKK
jgi:hypothetical protein